MKPRIMVVDDDRDVLELWRMRLQAQGYDVSFAMDGVSCMQVVRRETPDLIILDLGLPAGDGFVSLDRLKSQVDTSNIPVIVLTGREGEEHRQRAFRAGASAYFEKGCDKDRLLGAVRRHLGAGPPPAP